MSIHSVLVLLWMKKVLIPSEYISCIYFLFHIVKKAKPKILKQKKNNNTNANYVRIHITL